LAASSPSSQQWPCVRDVAPFSNKGDISVYSLDARNLTAVLLLYLCNSVSAILSLYFLLYCYVMGGHHWWTFVYTGSPPLYLVSYIVIYTVNKLCLSPYLWLRHNTIKLHYVLVVINHSMLTCNNITHCCGGLYESVWRWWKRYDANHLSRQWLWLKVLKLIKQNIRPMIVSVDKQGTNRALACYREPYSNVKRGQTFEAEAEDNFPSLPHQPLNI